MEIVCTLEMESQKLRIDIFLVVAGLRVWDVTWKFVEELVMFHCIMLSICVRRDIGNFSARFNRVLSFVGKGYKILLIKRSKYGNTQNIKIDVSHEQKEKQRKEKKG